eukprot:CAMPEP_0115871258 /NCGR_PEP_ID=MMETSP0287-20121206/22770_1 /TAXON_ID=412157 /ORGANISM="Chrysochromulina rotalis, Strain UIO044" /LENGTH=159 /DNA_ID=CAMNT_0003326047 /DNA_START=170 /DNA_END=649 /DNA_ORIENTATION=+
MSLIILPSAWVEGGGAWLPSGACNPWHSRQVVEYEERRARLETGCELATSAVTSAGAIDRRIFREAALHVLVAHKGAPVPGLLVLSQVQSPSYLVLSPQARTLTLLAALPATRSVVRPSSGCSRPVTLIWHGRQAWDSDVVHILTGPHLSRKWVEQHVL